MRIRIAFLTTLVVASLSAWTNPVSVSGSTAGENFFPQVVSDGEGGAVISWLKKDDDCYEVYSQRVDADGGIHDNWPSGGQVVSIMSGADHIGHRLNHHIIPGWYTSGGQTVNAGHAISFWANHFHVHEQTPYYDRGYYLQKTNATGGLAWNDEDPVPVLPTWPVPGDATPEDGDPISICPDGNGGCVVAMKAATNTSGGQQYGAWKIWIAAYNSDGSINTDWTDDNPRLIDANPDDNHGLIGCPKIVPWNDGDFLLVYVSSINATVSITAATTYLNFYEIDGDEGTTINHHTVSFVENKSTDWFPWISSFDIATNDAATTLYVAYLLRHKKKQTNCPQPVNNQYYADSLLVIEYSGSQPQNRGVVIDKWTPSFNNQPSKDELPLRAPSIAFLNDNDGAIVVYTRAKPGEFCQDNPMGQEPSKYASSQEMAYPTRQFYLKAFKVKNGVRSELWTLGDNEYTNASFHTPEVISNGAGGYVVTYSMHSFWDYSNPYASDIHLGEGKSGSLGTLDMVKMTLSGLNCSPGLLLTGSGGNRSVIVTWGNSTDAQGRLWSIRANNQSLPLP